MAELSKLILPVMDTSTGTITDKEYDIGGGGSAELESRVEALEDDVPFPLKKSGDAYGYENDNGDFVAFKSQADIDSAVAAAKVGTAAAGDVLSGKTFTNSTTSGVNGTMTNNGAVSQALNCGGSYTVPAGYHNGSGTVTANSLASQTPVDSGKTPVTAGAMLTGCQGWVNGSKVTGTMTNNGAVSQALNTSTTSYTVPAGYHDGSGKVSITTQTKTSKPTTRSASAATVTPDSGKVLSSVTVDTTSVPNTNSGTYTFPANDTGGTKDLGETNSYRYVNAQNVYNKGKADAGGQCVIHNFRLTHTFESTALGIEITDKKTNTVKVNKTVNSTGSWGSNPTNVNETVDGITYTLDISRDDWYTVKLIATSGSKSKTYSMPVSPNWSYAYTLDFLVIYDNNFY